MAEEKNGLNFVEEVNHQKPLKGIFSCKVYKHVNGEKRLIEEFEDKNLIVNMARDQMARLVAGEFTNTIAGNEMGRQISSIGFGTDSTKPAVGDTSLTGAFMKNLSGYDFPDMGQVRFFWELAQSEANGMPIIEFGLFCEDGALFARRRREKVGGDAADPIPKEADISLEGTWTIIF